MASRIGSALVWQRVNEQLVEAVAEAYAAGPLPNPPLELPEFPANPPKDAESLIRQASGIYAIDRNGFEMRLSEIEEKMLPDHVKRAIDPEAAKARWLEKNAETIAQRVLVLQARDWLTAALDEDSPDTDRWYLGVSVLIGLGLTGTEIARDGCYSLLEAIAFAVRPSALPHSNTIGRHQIAWSPQQTTVSPLPPHPAGAMAAGVILDILALGEADVQSLFAAWLENLSVSTYLCNTLEVPLRVLGGLNSADAESAPIFVRAGVQSLSSSGPQAEDVLVACAEHRIPAARRAVAEALPRIFTEDDGLALVLLDRLLEGEDESTVSMAATFVGLLARLAPEEFSPRAILIIDSGNQRALHRVVESGFRDYLGAQSSDPAELLPSAWVKSSEIGRSRLANLIVEQYRVAPEAFLQTCHMIQSVEESAYVELIRMVRMRSEEAASEMP